ncbi:hypothetical protein NQZ68_016651 [Dissostichus eleginoides]|nr:hypothetical protein NQZ68_016651 [Dissostichus eleginoides]
MVRRKNSCNETALGGNNESKSDVHRRILRGCDVDRNKHVYPVKDIGQIGQHCNPVHVLHVLEQWGVDFGEEEENFLAQITQASEDLAPGQSPDLGVQQQLVEVSAHLIAEDGQETGIKLAEVNR